MNKRHQTTALKIASTLAMVVLLVPEFAFAAEVVKKLVWEILTTISGTFLWLGGFLFDYAVNTYVIGFADTYRFSGIGYVVDTIWVTLRDIVNLTFIFGLVYIGFKMILGSDDSNTRSWLVNLIIAALLINFSLFITKAIVDFSNQIAYEIAEGGMDTTKGESRWSKAQLPKVEISATIMKLTGSASVFQLEDEGKVTAALKGGWGYIFGTTALFFIAAYVFFAAGLMLMIRFAMLNLFLVLSPVMFIGWIIPALDKYSKEYWSRFLRQAFFAPVFFIFVYISLQILKSLKGTIDAINRGSSLSDAFVIQAGKYANTIEAANTTLPIFILACIFLLASLIIAKKVGADGSNMAMSAADTVRKKVQRGALVTGKYAAANTAGRGARLVTTAGGRTLQRGINSMQQADRTTLRGRLARSVGRSNFVQGTVGGGAKAMQQAKFGLSRTLEEDIKMRNQTENAANDAITARTVRTAPLTATSTPAEIEARQNERNARKVAVSEMSNEQVIELARTNHREVIDPEFASLLTEAQVKALEESGVLFHEQVEELRQNRDTGTFADIEATLNNSNASVENLNATMEELNRVIATMSDERRNRLMRFDQQTGQLVGPLANNAIASRLTTANIDTMRQSGRATAAQMRQITNSRENGLRTIAFNGSLANPGSLGGSDPQFQDRQRRALFRNAQDAGRLPASVLASPGSARYLTPQIIEQFLQNNPSPQDLTSVRNNLENYLHNNVPSAGQTVSPNEVDTWNRWINSRPVFAQQFGL